MYNSIPYKTIKTSHSTDGCRRKRKFGKPWWSDRLTTLLSSMCSKEKLWLNANGTGDRRALKAEYVSARKTFDRAVQRTKRFYQYSLQREVLTEGVTNDTNFWKSIGKLDINQERKMKIPMEVLTDEGTVSNEVNIVLEKWKSCFSNLDKPMIPVLLIICIMDQQLKTTLKVSLELTQKPSILSINQVL